MSKHALSRIYERYVTELEFEDTSQISFIPRTPKEKSVLKSGRIYTPQYVARFFTQYLQANTTPRQFRGISVIDPACGSGIFLRSILEAKCNPFAAPVTIRDIEDAFSSVYAIDRDPNAAEATKLSLFLLHLIATGQFPRELKIHDSDALGLLRSRKLKPQSFGAVVSNPPYVKLDHLSDQERADYEAYLGDDRKGRVDSYLAFVKLVLELVEPSGFACLVLPQPFLLADNAANLRVRITREFVVRCLVDLSEIEVFPGVGTYSILIVLQRLGAGIDPVTRAQIVKCQGLVGPALQACLEGRSTHNLYFSVYETSQADFRSERWIVLPQSDKRMLSYFAKFRPISDYLEVRQGIVTGSDDVFIIDSSKVPADEREIFVPFLPDQEIMRYRISSRLSKSVFYPYVDDERVDEEQLRTKFPRTWKYLLSKHALLASRLSTSKHGNLWWRPARPRSPLKLLRPKIVCPHLMLTPRFAIDLRGRIAVSHSPYMISKVPIDEQNILKFFCAILNSSAAFWYVARHTYKYSKGYIRLEVSTLKDLPVPDPAKVPTELIQKIIHLVDRAIASGPDRRIDTEIDEVVANLYGFGESDRQVIVGKH